MPKGKKNFRRQSIPTTSHEADVKTGATDQSTKSTKRKHKHKHKHKTAQLSKEAVPGKSEYIDKELYVLHRHGYICLMGHWIERVAREALIHVPQHAIEKRKRRDGNPFHLTICKAMETTSQMRQRTALEGMTALANRSRPPINLGLGMVKDNATSTRSWYCSISWDGGQQIRSEYGLPPKDFHLTLGFDVKDHHVHKGPSTLVIHSSITTSLILTKEQIEGLREAAIIEAQTSAERSHISFGLALAQAELAEDEVLISKVKLSIESVETAQGRSKQLIEI
ncbi:hypothetical protein INT44_008113 [Umbelopsis vinacea]|uniref:Swiss Army Knife 2H phosphoesterase domain-containing protein n=1 Tax=Umbelopsis vinacea TaxID=44442 RepID=A0A8H7PQV3_9FUNG|nr:hypothetical protein INT44_008113 [Umbelopsis vinacea]